MKLLRTILILTLMMAGFAFVTEQPAAAETCISTSGVGDTDKHAGPFDISAGTTLTVTMTATPTYGTYIGIEENGAPVTSNISNDTPHTLSYTFTSDASADVYMDWQVNGEAANTYSITSDDCTLGESPMIPSQAVVGTFTQSAELYYEPGNLLEPFTIVEAGKSYWVAGQDESGMYRKVLIACTWVWVRAETVGPNFDEVWNGTPLPTTIVEVDANNNACAQGYDTESVPVEDGSGFVEEPETGPVPIPEGNPLPT